MKGRNRFIGQTAIDRKIENKKRAQSASLEGQNLVGRILHAVWGYNMTNNSYYVITRQTAKKVYGYAIENKFVRDSGYLAGYELPDPTKISTWNHKVSTPEGTPEEIEKALELSFSARFNSVRFNPSDDGTFYFKGGDLSFGYYKLHEGRENYFNHCD